MTVPLEQAQTNLSGLIARVREGETVTIEQDGLPVAALVCPPETPKKRTFGIWEGKWDVPDSAFSPETEKEIEDLFYGESE